MEIAWGAAEREQNRAGPLPPGRRVTRLLSLDRPPVRVVVDIRRYGHTGCAAVWSARLLHGCTIHSRSVYGRLAPAKCTGHRRDGAERLRRAGVALRQARGPNAFWLSWR
jgi:hypothetical protein